MRHPYFQAQNGFRAGLSGTYCLHKKKEGKGSPRRFVYLVAYRARNIQKSSRHRLVLVDASFPAADGLRHFMAADADTASPAQRILRQTMRNGQEQPLRGCYGIRRRECLRNDQAQRGSGRIKGYIDYQDLEKTVASSLIYPGHLDREELGVWYDAADVGVMSSYTEQCSYACLEMMSRGLPVVASDGNNLSDMFRDGENAFVARIGNVVDTDSYARRLAQKIVEALEASPEQIRTMKNNNYRLLRDRYSAETMARNYIALINGQ